MKLLHKILARLKREFYLKILRRKYYRTGQCNMCGRCCEKIYVKHGKGTIKDEEEFEKLKTMHHFYRDLEIMGKDEMGLVFRCKKLNKETRLCTDHKKRGAICRNYPQEEIFSMGATLGENCGYKFEPIVPFSEVFEKTLKKSKKN